MIGFSELVKQKYEKNFGNAPEGAFPPKPKTEAMILDLRTRWIDAFLATLKGLNPEIPVDVATEWVNYRFPKTAVDLAASITSGGPQKLAFRLADVWEAK